MPSPEPLLECHNLRVVYGAVPALEIEQWQWLPGQRWAVLGGNGAGKSTLARLLSDEIRPTRGYCNSPGKLCPGQVVHLSFDQQSRMMERDRRLDDSETRADAFDPGTTVTAAILGPHPPDFHFRELLQRFGLEAIAERGLRFISTGESRRMLLARALYLRPRLLLLDDPLAGLDANAQTQMQALLATLLHAEKPRLLPLLSRAEDIPDGISHVLWLESGRVRAQGPRRQVLAAYARARPAHRPPALPTARAAHPPPPQPLIEMHGLNLRYGETPILTDIHWQFDHAQHCLITGPNGAGKSTLLSLISGDNPKGYGQPLWLFGRRRGSGESVWDIRSRLGLVGTAWQLQRRRRERVLEVVASGLYDSDGLFRDCSGSDRAAVLAWIEAAGLGTLAESRFDRLSFGEQRLALIARAMVKTPHILILDEPCLGLDAEHRDAVLALSERIAARGHTQLLYVSHRPEEVPACINQWLRLEPHPAGGFTAQVSADRIRPLGKTSVAAQRRDRRHA